MRVRPALALPLVALLGACTVGPNYAGPPKVGSSGDTPAQFVRGGNAVTTAAPAAGRWWTGLGDPTLNALEERALAGNPSIAVAQARVRQARAALRIERANELPSVAAQGMYVHAQLPGVDLGSSNSSGGTGGGGTSGGTTGDPTGGAASSALSDLSSLDFYNVGLDASWEIDLFGGQRRTIQAARAQLAGAEANVADAQVQLTADVAQAYVGLRDVQQRLELSRRSAQMQQQMLDLTRQRQSRGAASALDVERLQGQVQATQAQIVPLAAQAETYQNALAVLTGTEPGSIDPLVATAAAIPLPPASVPIGDPAELLQRRPDIRAAERQLAAQTARIGVAEAARFPRLSFMGILGIGGTHLSDLTDLGNTSSILMPQLQWSFLDFGRGAARVRQAKAVRDEAEAQYRQAVLRALQDAEDSLSRYGHQRESVASLARVKESADRASALMQQRYRAGTATLIDTLDAERNRVAAEQNLAQATAGLTNYYVALQKALGLGWEPVAPTTPAPMP